MDSENSPNEVIKNFLEQIRQSEHSENALYNIFNYKVALAMKPIIRRLGKRAVDVIFEIGENQDEKEIFDYFKINSKEELQQKILEIVNSDDFMDEKSLNEHIIFRNFIKIDVKYALADSEGAYFVADMLDNKNVPIAINIVALKNIVEEK